MFLINFKKNFIKTIILSFLMILFSVLIITLNFNNNNISYNDYLNLPFYFKLIFLIFIPIFNEYNYLFSFIMFYFLIIIIIYSIYLARVKYYNIISPENIYKTEIKALLSRYLHIAILIFSTFLSLIITSSICYKTFFINNIIEFINCLILSFSIFNIFNYKLNNKFKYINYLLLFYIIILFILNIFINNDIIYYFSPINILLQTNNNFFSLIIILVSGLIINLNIYLNAKKTF